MFYSSISNEYFYKTVNISKSCKLNIKLGERVVKTFNGSVARQMNYLQNKENTEFKNWDSKSITGWIIVLQNKKYTKLPISLYIGDNLIEDEAFNKAVKFVLPQ